MRAPLALLLASLAGPALAQTMLDQEERLIELHSLLLALPALEAPGALAPLQARLGLEVVGVPLIDGKTGPRPSSPPPTGPASSRGCAARSASRWGAPGAPSSASAGSPR